MLMKSMSRCLAALVVVGAALAAPSVPTAAAASPAAAPMAAPSQKAANLNVGYAHTCVVNTKGKVWCWGYNGYGQLGDGTATTRTSPVGVVGIPGKVKAVSTSYSHTCALTTKGKVWCWGYNAYGQLGNNTTTSSLAPVPVANLDTMKSISIGYIHSCALSTKGKAWCWGYNTNGQLGNGTTTQALVPVAVKSMTKGVKSISAGYFHTCAITSTSKARCWGDNAKGELGDNSNTNRVAPVTVYGLSRNVKQLSAGYASTCAVTTKGKALCWGYNAGGQLGNGTTANAPAPVTVTGLSRKVASVHIAVGHACALTTAGKALCWGHNATGQLGDNSTTNRLVPAPVYNLGKATKISVGYLHSCAVTSKKAVRCWGYNAYGMLGNGTTTNSPQPVKVVGF